jgi:GT2 family glycosyltransferase
MLVRRRAFAEVGGFDEGFFLYMEDADFCRRLHRAGWEVEYLPGVSLRHGYARASSEAGASVLRSPARRRHMLSLARYWRKHLRALIGGGP